MSRQFYAHSGAREQFFSNQKHSIFRRELTKETDWTEEAALWRQIVHKTDGTLQVKVKKNFKKMNRMERNLSRKT